MAGGMLFPDIAGALSSGAQAGAASAQGRFLMEDRAARNEIAPLIPKALQGDREALDKIGARHPDTLMKITPLLERADASTRARAKETAEWTTKAAMGVLSLPEAERPAAYQAALADGQRLGYKIDMPPQYDRAVEGRLRMVVNQARSVSDFLKSQGEGVTYMDAGGGGSAAPPAAGGGVNQYNIGNVRPVGGGPNSGFQQPASLDDGIRLAVNNVKAYPAKFNNGQPMTLLQIGERWAPRGDGANDPRQWAINVASIGGLDPNQPLDLNDPMIAAKFARGVHGAEHGANKVLPPERYAQAITGGAAPPGIAQGDAAPRADSSGNPLPPDDSIPIEAFKGVRLPPGYKIGTQGGKIFSPVPGYVQVMPPGGGAPILWPVPKPKEQGSGPFAGNSVEAQALNMLIANGTLTPQQAAELAAGKTITNPADGSVMFMTPSGLFKQAPGGPAMPAAPAGGPAPATQPGMIPVTPPKPVQMTEGQSNAALYADRMREADAIIARNEKAGMSLGGRALENMPGGVGNFLQSEEYQLFEQARRNFINAVLRRESGAVIAETEFANAERQYFPRPGDSDAVLKQKAENRRSAIEGISRAAGPTYKPQSAPPAAPAQTQTAKPGTYMGPDNKPVAWPEIEATAKNRGITPEDVINRLGLKPTGMQ